MSGELLTLMGKDANNQMYHIAWAVVRVENLEKWCWFLSLLHDDSNLNNGNGLTIIFDSHKIGYQKQSIESVPGIFMPTLRRGIPIVGQDNSLKWAEDWLVYPSGFQELEDRKGDENYEYMHLNKDPDNEVSYWFSQDTLFNAYQFSIRPIPRTNLWKRNEHQPPLPPIIRRMSGKPQKERIKSPTKESTQVNRVERKMTCSNCWEQGHNTAGCKNKARPQPKKVVRPIGLNRKHARPQCASRGGGRGSRCDRMDGYSRCPLIDEQDEVALKEHLKEEARVEQEYMDRYRAEQEYEARIN
nr:zinc finger, PMZ-type [Tanacetum cinerariifolium]